jgi:hypothetical protein
MENGELDRGFAAGVADAEQDHQPFGYRMHGKAVIAFKCFLPPASAVLKDEHAIDVRDANGQRVILRRKSYNYV